MTHPCHTRGFTLLEVVLSIAVASGITLTVFSAFQLIDSVRMRQQNAGIVSWEGDILLAGLRTLVARGVTAPGPQESSDTLTLDDGATVSEVDGALVLTGDGDEISLSSSRIRVSSLSFTGFGDDDHSDIVRITFTLSTIATTSRTYYEHEYSTTFYAY